LTSGDLVF